MNHEEMRRRLEFALAYIRSRSLVADPLTPGLPNDFEPVTSEIQVVQSQELLTQVALKLNLVNDEEFDPTKPRMRYRLIGMLQPYLRLPDDLVHGPSLTELQKIDAVVDNVRGMLEVSPAGGRSRVISLTFKSRDPQVAASFVNTLAEMYVEHQTEVKEKATQQANTSITEKLAGLRAKAEEPDRRLEKFRTSTGLIQGKDTTLVKQHISELSTQLTAATQARVDAATKFENTKRAVTLGIGSDASSQVLASHLIQELRKQQAQIAARVAGMGSQLGDQHPSSQEGQTELADVQRRIDAEIKKVIASVEGDYRTAVAREEALRQELDAAKAEMARVSDDEAQLNQLQREDQANRLLYESFLQRANETSVKDIQIPDARIISHAAAAQNPYFPNVKIFALVGLVLSSVLALIGVLLIEGKDRGFRSSAELERVLGAPVIGFLPAIRNRNDRDDSDPLSVLGSAITDIQVRLCSGDLPKCLLVASAPPREGKTTFSLFLARIATANGKRVLLIDADMRRSGLQSRNNALKGVGLSDFLHGRVSFDDTLRHDNATGVTIMACGSPSRNPAGLLSSRKMRALIEDAKVMFDLVIIDSPAITAGSDAWMLSKIADETVLFVRWGSTGRALAKSAIDQLVQAGAKVTAALTMVDLGKISEYSATDGVGYSKAIQRYYPNPKVLSEANE